jgi:hypothetical protein
MRSLAIVAVLLASSPAFADDKATSKLAMDLFLQGDIDGIHKPILQISERAFAAPPDSAGYNENGAVGYNALATSVATGADGTSAWVAVDLSQSEPCGMSDPGCFKRSAQEGKEVWGHYTLLLDKGQPLVEHVGMVIPDSNMAKLKTLMAPDKMDDKIGPEAADLRTLLGTLIASPKAMVDAVSDRKDVVLYGSDASEKYTGGAVVKKTLTGWGLSIKLRDGIMAGLTSSKKVGWMAANVDVQAKGDKRATPYRMTLVVEQTGKAWKVVQIHFSYDGSNPS